MKEIEITISREGKITIDTKGFQGKECVDDTEDLIKKLGIIDTDKKKPEYDKKVRTVATQMAGH